MVCLPHAKRSLCTLYAGPIATEAELRTAVAQGGAVTLTAPITLTGGELVLSSILSIDGAGNTIDAGGNSRIFNVRAGGSLFASALTLSNAKASLRCYATCLAGAATRHSCQSNRGAVGDHDFAGLPQAAGLFGSCIWSILNSSR